jgi:YD repeat-containing protein
VIQAVDGSEIVNYTYDHLNRLTSASTNGTWGENYTYDGFGNLTGQIPTISQPSPVRLAPVPDAKDTHGIVVKRKQNPVVAEPQPERARQFAVKRIHVSLSTAGEAQNPRRTAA